MEGLDDRTAGWDDRYDGPFIHKSSQRLTALEICLRAREDQHPDQR